MSYDVRNLEKDAARRGCRWRIFQLQKRKPSLRWLSSSLKRTWFGVSLQTMGLTARFDDCKYLFTVFAFRPGGRRRVYQLEVIPHEDVGHRDEKGELFGPHEHIGQLAQEVRVGNLNCKHHEQWFREFLSRANIRYGGRYFGPFEGGLFQ